jgi:hypothetical protein
MSKLSGTCCAYKGASRLEPGQERDRQATSHARAPPSHATLNNDVNCTRRTEHTRKACLLACSKSVHHSSFVIQVQAKYLGCGGPEDTAALLAQLF